MKTDITSDHRILSSKIKVGWKAVFFTVLWGLAVILPGPAQADTDILMAPETLRSLPRERVVLVDTRSSFKYFVGHIPHAVHLGGWEQFTHRLNGVRGLLNEDRNFIVERLRPFGIAPDKTLVVYGEPDDPWRTDGRFFWMFERYGFKKVAILEGGLDGWSQTGGAIERGRGDPPAPSSLSAADIHFDDGVTASQEWIAQRLGANDVAIVDNRTRKEYDGATPYGSSRGGHIPHAIHIHWPAFYTAAGRIKSREELTRQMKGYGIGPDQEVVVYCTGGVRSGMAYFVFRYLGYRVRNYDGSWWDWSLNPNLPVESS